MNKYDFIREMVPKHGCRWVAEALGVAALADELDALTVRGFEDDELHDLADRLRAIGGEVGA